MKNVIKSYLPFLLWLLVAACSLTPQYVRAGDMLAQRTYRIGYLAGGAGPTFDAFREGLRDAGYVEGRDVVIETRFSEGRAERFPALIAELIERKVDLLVAGSPPGVIAAIKADTSIPIVTAGFGDPAAMARTLGRPASHITGTTLPVKGIAGRWIEMLAQACPDIARVAVLTNPANPSRDTWLADLRQAAVPAGIKLDIHDVGDREALGKALAAIASGGAGGLIVTGDPVFLIERARIVTFAREGKLPAAYFSKLFADDGGLLSYGPSLEDSYRKAPRYVDRILKGAKPADLPMEPATVELVVNLRAAKQIGVAIPDAIVRRADKVIE